MPITYSITLKAVMGSLQSSFTWTLTAVDSPAVSTAGFSGGGNSAFKSAINLPTLSYKLAANNSLVITSNDFSKYNISSYNYIQDNSAKTFSNFNNNKLSLTPTKYNGGKYTFYFYAIEGQKYLQQVNVEVYGGAT